MIDKVAESLQPIRIEDLPIKRGGHAIERYLIGGRALNSGCWIKGKTVYGDVSIGGKAWGTYTRPVFAYLEPLEVIDYSREWNKPPLASFAVGHSARFIRETGVSYSVSPAIERVNALSSLFTGYTGGLSWGAPGVRKVPVVPCESGSYIIYQLYLVYAHCATSAGETHASAFRTSKRLTTGGRDDLFYLSAISTQQHIVKPIDKSIPPLNWEDVQREVLLNGYETSSNTGKWAFDYSVFDYRNYRY